MNDMLIPLSEMTRLLEHGVPCVKQSADTFELRQLDASEPALKPTTETPKNEASSQPETKVTSTGAMADGKPGTVDAVACPETKLDNIDAGEAVTDMAKGIGDETDEYTDKGKEEKEATPEQQPSVFTTERSKIAALADEDPDKAIEALCKLAEKDAELAERLMKVSEKATPVKSPEDKPKSEKSESPKTEHYDKMKGYKNKKSAAIKRIMCKMALAQVKEAQVDQSQADVDKYTGFRELFPKQPELTTSRIPAMAATTAGVLSGGGMRVGLPLILAGLLNAGKGGRAVSSMGGLAAGVGTGAAAGALLGRKLAKRPGARGTSVDALIPVLTTVLGGVGGGYLGSRAGKAYHKALAEEDEGGEDKQASASKRIMCKLALYRAKQSKSKCKTKDSYDRMKGYKKSAAFKSVLCKLALAQAKAPHA